jgi:hypothetical protein
MNFEDLRVFLDSSNLHTIYPLMFPSDSEIGSTFNITGGSPERDSVNTITVRIVTRERHPQTSIEKSDEIMKYLQLNLKGAFFNGKKILKVTNDTPTPLFIGEDLSLYYASRNYTILEG